MALQRGASKALGCSGCQQWILRSFMATAGIPFFNTLPPPQQQRRTISQHPRRANEERERIQNEEELVLDRINDALGGDTPSTQTYKPSPSQPSSESIPWYLQSQEAPKQEQSNPILARQKLPDLPSHPPALLSPLLNHLAIDLGMADLTILDLRTLDPPPALGANLLMVLCTARSEKHLHISADKLCRYLRTTHHLRPYADGLLGRNELKLKMRRKAKRSRLLSAVGAKGTGEGELDDGIRTGWVCVNIGRVKGGELPAEVAKVQRAEGVVGFGAMGEGCSVVVQMLTEEKRGELELERLWGDMLGRARREAEKEEGMMVVVAEGDRGVEMEGREVEEPVAVEEVPANIAQQARAFGTTAHSTSVSTTG